MITGFWEITALMALIGALTIGWTVKDTVKRWLERRRDG